MDTASLETASIETVSLDSTGATAIGLAGSPTTVVAVWLIWSACGLLLAQVMARRGHDRRLMGALGCALGPFMLYIYLHPTRHREPAPLVLDAGSSQPGVRVMVGVGASPTAVADVLPLIDLLPEHVGHVDLVARIDIELTDGPWTASTEATADTLRGASVFLADRHPGLVLVPGSPGSALGEFAIAGDYDVVLMAGSTRELDALGRVLDREGIAPLLLAHRRAGR